MKKIYTWMISLLCICALSVSACAVEGTTDLPQSKLPMTADQDIAAIAPAGSDVPAADPSAVPGTDAPAGSGTDVDILPDENGTFANIWALYQYWGCTGGRYPDYVCGVWSTDGSMDHLTVAVTKDEAGEAGKEEIRALLRDTSTLTFTYQSYAYADLWAVQKALEPFLGDDTGAYGIGIHGMENCVVIDIDMSNENSEAFMQEVYAQYGDMVRFEDCTGMRFVLTDETGSPDGAWYDAGADKTQTHQYTYVLALFAFALFAFCAVWLTRFRGTPVFQAATGKTATARRTSRKEAAARIRHSTAAPDAAVLSSLLQKIETS